MSAFDQNDVRKAVAELTQPRRQKFQDLFPAKDVILALPEKRASYGAIAAFLT